MEEVEINVAFSDIFSIIDSDLNGVTGEGGNVVIVVYDPSNTTGVITPTVTELANGNYTLNATLTSLGTWKVVLSHPTYIPILHGGKSESYICTDKISRLTTIDTVVDDILIDTGTTLPAQITSEHTTTKGVVTSAHSTTDALITSETTDVESHVTSEHTTTKALVTSSHSTTDALITSETTGVESTITSAHATTDALVTSETTGVETHVTGEHTTTKALVTSSHSTTDTLIGTVQTNLLGRFDTVDADIDLLQNARIGYLVLPLQMQKPLSGTETYRVNFYCFNGLGTPVDAIPNITIYEFDETPIIATTAMTAYTETGHYYYDFALNSSLSNQVIQFKVTLSSQNWRANVFIDTDDLQIDRMEGKIDDIKTKTDQLPDDLESVLDNITTVVEGLDVNLDIMLGLNDSNKVIDQTTFINGRLVSARIRLFEDATLAVVIATYQLTASYDIYGNMENWQVVEV